MADTKNSREKHAAVVARWRARNPLKTGYWNHKHGAKQRGIAFLLTFEEWTAIWIDSGKWNQRGLGVDSYCMARSGDVGPYAIGNVRICTRRENNAEQAEMLRGKPASGNQLAALSRGWTSQWKRRGKPLNDKQRAALAKAIKARWA